MRRKDVFSRIVAARFFLAAFCCLALALQAQAVIVGTTDTSDFSDNGSPWFAMNWDYVYQTAGGTSVAVGGFHMLTAKHYSMSVGTTFDINSDQFEVVSIASPPPDSGETVGPDLRILGLKNNTHPGTPLPGYYQLYTGSFSPGQDTIIVGTGKTGVDYTTYYTEDENSSREKRWGTNEYTQSIREKMIGSGGAADFSTQCIQMDFFSGDTQYEAGYGDGDSGGGVFVKENGVWKLAGVNLYRQSNGIQGQYDKSFAASIPAYAGWIGQAIPEPASAVLMLLGAPLLIRRLRKKQSAG